MIVVRTILDHVRENERKGVPTLLHIDRLEQLVPLYQRANGSAYTVPESEFSYSLQTRDPIILALREFGGDLGGDSHHVIVYGESRIPREQLPEGVQRTFRRTFNLEPTAQDLEETLAVQMKFTRAQAEKTGIDPFSAGFESQLAEVARSAAGLAGRDIQQAILNIASRHKAEWDGEHYVSISPQEMTEEFRRMVLERGLDSEKRLKQPIGFIKTPR